MKLTKTTHQHTRNKSCDNNRNNKRNHPRATPPNINVCTYNIKFTQTHTTHTDSMELINNGT